MKTVVDYGIEGSPFTLTTGKPFTWNRYSEGIDPHINSDGSLDMGKNIFATYYIPNSNSDWKMICNFDKNISDSYLEIGYHCDNNSTRRKFSFFSNKTEMNGGNDVATHPQIRNTEQYVTIERRGNSIILQYPTENGVETITTPYVGTVNHGLAIQNHGTGNVTIKQFIYYDQNGGQVIGTSEAYGGIYQQFILGSAKGEGSPFYTLNEPVIPATVTSGNILNIGCNQRIDYDLPTNVNANWTATYDFKMFPHDTKEIYFQFLSNDNEYGRGIRFFTNRSTFKSGSRESVTYPALTDDTDKQYITYTKRGSVLTIEYPDIEGNITRITTEFMGTASFRLRVTDNDASPLNCITMFTFSYIN